MGGASGTWDDGAAGQSVDVPRVSNAPSYWDYISGFPDAVRETFGIGPSRPGAQTAVGAAQGALQTATDSLGRGVANILNPAGQSLIMPLILIGVVGFIALGILKRVEP